MERQILVACGSGVYGNLDPMSRKALLKTFRNQGWPIPADLSGEEPIIDELTLRKAMELCLRYPEMRDSPTRERIEQCFEHLTDHFGSEFPVKQIWIPQIKEYQVVRTSAGAAPGTVNREKSALSKLFQVLIELRHMEINSARLVKPLSEKFSKRQAYVSYKDFQSILEHLPLWFRPVAQTAYYTGMRRGEILGLTWKKVNLPKRIMYLGPDEVKERQWKRVPIHRDLIPILENIRTEQVVGLDRVFLHNGQATDQKNQVRWCWERKASKTGLDPAPRFHDLRHTWKTNARRSGMHPEIEKAIMGHSQRGLSVHEGYGMISDEELVKAIDAMTFDHGETQILAPAKKTKPTKRRNSGSAEKQVQNVSTRSSKKSAHIVSL